jgi:predicted patatin/cPLA2 family phospholipase
MSIGLVLEGGGMRGWYTCGVLTVFTEHGIQFPAVYGISAGALNALSYISGQNSREYNQTFLRYASDERYVSVENLNRTGSLFGFDFIFGELFHERMPFDYRAFFHSPMNLRVGATDLKTGRPVFFNKSELDEDFTAVQASCSLPFMSNIVSCRGYELLDGGCSMPIPIERSIFDGNEWNVVVLTRDSSYRKGPRPEYPRPVLRVKYGEYPNFVDAMMGRSETYNNELDVCRRQENSGKTLIIRPESPIMASRYEKDPAALAQLYEMGVRDAEKSLEAVEEFLKKSGL